MNSEYPDSKQRTAICHQSWKDKDKKKKTPDSLTILDGQVRTPDMSFKIVSDDDRVIEGYFTTKDVDRGNDVSLPSAFEKTMKQYMDSGGVICWMHKWDKPLGKVLSYKIDDKGVFIKAQIAKGVGYIDDTWKLMKQGVVKCFSYGYRILDSAVSRVGEKIVQELKEVDLLEITVATVPMNSNATFVVAGGGVKSVVIPKEGEKEGLFSGGVGAFIKALEEAAETSSTDPTEEEAGAAETSSAGQKEEAAPAEGGEEEVDDVPAVETKTAVDIKGLTEDVAQRDADNANDLGQIFYLLVDNMVDINPTEADAQKKADSLLDEFNTIAKQRCLGYIKKVRRYYGYKSAEDVQVKEKLMSEIFNTEVRVGTIDTHEFVTKETVTETVEKHLEELKKTAEIKDKERGEEDAELRSEIKQMADSLKGLAGILTRVKPK